MTAICVPRVALTCKLGLALYASGRLGAVVSEHPATIVVSTETSAKGAMRPIRWIEFILSLVSKKFGGPTGVAL
jgi:hypothetical protein